MALADFLKGEITQRFWADNSGADPVTVGQDAPPSPTRLASDALSFEVLEDRVAPANLAKGLLGHKGAITLDYLLRD